MVRIITVAASILIAALFVGFMLRDIIQAEDEGAGLWKKWLPRYLVLLPCLAAAGFAVGYLGL